MGSENPPAYRNPCFCNIKHYHYLSRELARAARDTASAEAHAQSLKPLKAQGDEESIYIYIYIYI